MRLSDSITYLVILAVAMTIPPILGFMGILDITLNKDSKIYGDLITASFTLAGLTIAAISFSLDRKPEIQKLINPTILFLVSGLLIYANIILIGFVKFDIDVSRDNILVYALAWYEFLGIMGIMVFFYAIAYLIYCLLQLRSSLIPKK